MSDRHFDLLAKRFAEKIYGSAKGAIRLAVLQEDLGEILPHAPLRVLDVGAGLGHMALWLAERGHHVTLAEPAEPMLTAARERFAQAGRQGCFVQLPWQALKEKVEGPFDLILCHAVLEWLAEPASLLAALHSLTAPAGWLSLAFYNKDALIYRNLLKGHLRKLRRQAFAGEKHSLTPQRPLDPRELATQLASHWMVERTSGVRIVHDYMAPEFQARCTVAELLEMELAYRRHPAFIGLGRYLHWICRPLTERCHEIHTAPAVALPERLPKSESL
jgi:S-adenosylmethionine-dependent methyltransferase